MPEFTHKLIKYFLLVGGLIMISGCVFYKTLQLNETSKNAIETTSHYKNVILISDPNSNVQYRLNPMVLTDTTLSGKLYIAEGAHVPHKRSIRKHKAETQGWQPLQTMHIYLKEGKLAEGNFSTSLDNIQSIEIHETATGKSVITSISIPVGISAAAFGIIILTSDCACPFVESYNADTSLFHGSLFPGAIFKSLARADYLELANPSLNEDSTLSLRIFNSMPEVEYIDQLELYRVKADGYANMASLGNGSFIGYNNVSFAIKAISGDLINVTEQLTTIDGISYDFSNLDQTDELNSLEVTFKRKGLSNHTKLTLVGKQSRWLEKVADYLFNNIGNRYDEWVALKDKGDGADWLNSQREKGISLKVSIRENGTWRSIGYLDTPGTLSFRKLVLDLDLTHHTDSLVELKFESAYKIWELDQIALTDDFKMNLEVESVPFTKVLNQDSLNIKPEISDADSSYYVQKQGGYILLETGVPLNQSSLFLKGRGYYHHAISNEKPPNYKFLKTMHHKLAFHEMSKALEQAKQMVAFKKK